MTVRERHPPEVTMGILYLRQARRVLERDYMCAFNDQDWNTAIRRATEAAEYAAKAVW
jgi:hypothetical protein